MGLLVQAVYQGVTATQQEAVSVGFVHLVTTPIELEPLLAMHVVLASTSIILIQPVVRHVLLEVTAAQLEALSVRFVHRGMSPIEQEDLHQMIVPHVAGASISPG